MSMALLVASAFASIARADDAPAGDVQRGRELYWHGVTADGSPSHATTGSGIALSGDQVSCVHCHRPSGFGSSEGGKYVLPITGPILFSPRELNRNRIFYKLFKEAQPRTFSARMREPRMRPAYTDVTLAKALREGIDPASQKFDPEMPRYDLSDSDMRNLTAYLRTLSAKQDPGIDENAIHLATVVNDDADPRESEAVLKTVSAFFDWMNTTIDGHRSKPNYSPYYHSDFQNSFRHWQLHVWRLHGPPQTWPEQLREYYRQAPVFAVVSGSIAGSWAPIGKFCDEERVPCIFPDTELPKTENAEYGYSLYFSRGLELEAEALARYLAEQLPGDASLVQIYCDDPDGTTPANAFERAIRAQAAGAQVQNVRVSSAGELTQAMREAGIRARSPAALVVWPGKYRAAALTSVGEWKSVKLISLASDALESAEPGVRKSLPTNLIFPYPYELPSVPNSRVFRVRQWMNSRNVEIRYPRLQFEAYYALTLLEAGFDQILDDYFRDYLIEAMEHEAESHLNNGTHPTLALGPGQRFASKGAYVVRADAASAGGIRAVSNWIVP
ncbi:MAG: ABC transporter substrate-binding protein [Acidobacteria bacterium]|nr:ABC transporter substrate-binding protein [Acidobacteriota bacterium]